MRKAVLSFGLIAAFVVSGTAAWASHGTNYSLNKSTTGASFSGYWEWYARGEAHGGFHFWGTLRDTICDDGDNVYTKAKVEGYSWQSFYGTQCGSRSQNYEVYDPQATYVRSAEWSVCRDRSVPYSDNCGGYIHVTR